MADGYFSSLSGGLGTPFTLALMMLAAGDWEAMQGQPLPRWLLIAGWATTAVVVAASGIYLWQTFAPSG